MEERIKKFALIGVGFVAERHIKAIYETGNVLVAAVNPSDSVGILDKYFPECEFFTSTERFERHLQKLKRADNGVDYVSVCSPNHLHDAHIRLGLAVGADVICEKPAVINPRNIYHLKYAEKQFGGKVNLILQLRLHPKIKALKKKIDSSSKIHKVSLQYLTPRGPWYHVSWKGDMEKSGGLATNIGVHLFDMLNYVFGPHFFSEVRKLDSTKTRIYGDSGFQKAAVDWMLSIDRHIGAYNSKKPHRSLIVDGEEIDFTSGFEDLHTKSYEQILKGKGFCLDDGKDALEIVKEIRDDS
jgi:UDP-N-acetyl-2-amino-2-deoxyglucuronate dehydrogenase